jgi:hypothetical protein
VRVQVEHGACESAGGPGARQDRRGAPARGARGQRAQAGHRAPTRPAATRAWQFPSGGRGGGRRAPGRWKTGLSTKTQSTRLRCRWKKPAVCGPQAPSASSARTPVSTASSYSASLGPPFRYLARGAPPASGGRGMRLWADRAEPDPDSAGRARHGDGSPHATAALAFPCPTARAGRTCQQQRLGTSGRGSLYA